MTTQLSNLVQAQQKVEGQTSLMGSNNFYELNEINMLYLPVSISETNMISIQPPPPKKIQQTIKEAKIIHHSISHIIDHS